MSTEHQNSIGRVPFTRGLSHYILLGTIIGIYGSIVSLALNVFGALGIGEEPFKLLRVYSTFFYGEEAFSLPGSPNNGIVLFLALMMHCGTGAIIGMPLYLVYHRTFPHHSPLVRAANAAWLGVMLWGINFYAILSWFQPVMLKWLEYGGEPRAFILERIPWWVGVLTHISFTEVVIMMQPTPPSAR
ncbi:MAG: hypothetical protein O3A46_02080 [Candidatus Poribacteria bacterium]|nr:hypothetical protein [Candidatus Poribacteria bacterium]